MPKFTADLPSDIHATSARPFTVTIGVEQTEAGALRFGASVERFVTGYGWEHILHLPPTDVADRVGLHDIELHVPELPLPAATYSLGLFLTLSDATGAHRTVDVRSWTYDNALSLHVDGSPSRGAVRLPITIEMA